MAMDQGQWRLWHTYKTGHDNSRSCWYNSVNGMRLSYATLVPQLRITQSCYPYEMCQRRDSTSTKEDAFEEKKKKELAMRARAKASVSSAGAKRARKSKRRIYSIINSILRFRV